MLAQEIFQLYFPFTLAPLNHRESTSEITSVY